MSDTAAHARRGLASKKELTTPPKVWHDSGVEQTTTSKEAPMTTKHTIADATGVTTVRVATVNDVVDTPEGPHVKVRFTVVTEVRNNEGRRIGTHVTASIVDTVDEAAAIAASVAEAVAATKVAG